MVLCSWRDYCDPRIFLSLLLPGYFELQPCIRHKQTGIRYRKKYALDNVRMSLLWQNFLLFVIDTFEPLFILSLETCKLKFKNQWNIYSCLCRLYSCKRDYMRGEGLLAAKPWSDLIYNFLEENGRTNDGEIWLTNYL